MVFTLTNIPILIYQSFMILILKIILIKKCILLLMAEKNTRFFYELVGIMMYDH